MKFVLQDVSYALRQLRKSPGFAATAILTLALGITATTTILSWISATLLNPIPGAARTGDMVSLMVGERSEHPTPPLSYPDFADIRADAKSFSGMVAEHQDFMSITGNGQPERIFGELVSARYFETLGVRPILGQSLQAAMKDERATAPVAVLSYGLWQRHFAGDPNIVGKTIEINRYRYTIVGVAPREFRGVVIGLRSDIWMPVGNMNQVWGWDPLGRRNAPFLNVFGVLRPGVDRRTAQNELAVIMQGLVARYPTDHPGNNTVSLDPLWRSPFGANVYLAGTLPILLALAGVLLLLACANVANLLLVRSVSRRKEFAIRMSMGAYRWRLVRQLMLENLLLALAGGGVAVTATLWLSKLLMTFLPAIDLPLAINGEVDSRVMLAACAVSLLTALISGLVPAVRSSQVAPASILKDEALNTAGGLHKSRLAAGLVIAQVALSLVLLACAGLFVRSLEAAQSANPGFDANHVLLTTFDLDPLGYTDKTGTEFQNQLLARIKELPGVQSATLADFSPLSFTIHSGGVLPQGYVPLLHESLDVDWGIVGPDYLHTLQTPLIAGRDFTTQDNGSASRVAIVNQAFVDRFWRGQNAIGKQINDGHQSWTVVGVAANGKYRRLVYNPAPLFLMPLEQRYRNEVILHVRVAGDPKAMVHPIEQAIHRMNPNLPIYGVRPLSDNLRTGSAFERIAVTLAASFGILALLLAGVGIYGVVAYTSRQRTHEIGIRMALGAGKAHIFGQVLRQGLQLTVAGLAAGLIAALFLTRFVRNLLYGVGTMDWLTFAAVSALLGAVALVACLLPARRAAQVEPMQALRTE